MGHKQREALLRSAVQVSFWVGACGLVAMKGVAYMISGSNLIRAAMFESLGDVMSSVIMWVAQARVADASNRDDYPVGKRRISPLGVLVFAAFAMSAMTALALESLQAVLTSPEEADAPKVTAEAALQRFFEEKPLLRRFLSPRSGQVEAVIAEYSGVGGAAVDGTLQEASDDGNTTVLLLLCACIVVKFFCLVWCSYVVRRTNSDIAQTLSQDHRNDVISNACVVAVTLLVAWAQEHGYQSVWLDKVDPLSSLLLSLWIAYNWVDLAMEQITLLSNHRVDAEVADRIASAARRHLEAGLLEFCDVNAYHAGKGCAAELHLQLRAGERQGAAGAEVAKAIEAVEQAVLEADCDVCEVYTRLRTPSKPKSGGSPTKEDHSWVGQYR